MCPSRKLIQDSFLDFVMPIKETFSSMGAELLHWLRRHLTADALTESAKTAMWVVPMTILIWIYSEQEQRKDAPDEPVLITLRSTEADRIVSLLKPGDAVPLVDLRGPKASIERVKTELNRAGDNHLVTIEVPPGLQGVRDVFISSQIERAPIFLENGIEIMKVVPSTIQVRIDTLVQRELEVVPSTNANIEGDAVFEPKIVKIRVPSEVYRIAQAKLGDKGLVAYAQFPANGEPASPGSHERVSFSVQLPPELQGDHTTLLGSPNVSATYNVKATIVSAEIPSLIIRTSFAGRLAEQVSVKTESTLGNVQISGPKAKCDAIIERATTNTPPVPYATIKIDGGDAPTGAQTSGTVSKTLEYSLSDKDVIVTEPNRTIDVTITRRPTAP